MSNLQFCSLKIGQYRFRPTWLGTLVTMACIPLFIKLGLWQYHKAEAKLALQATYDQYEKSAPVALPAKITAGEPWRYKQVKVDGEYVSKYQVFLDNQVEGEQVGYHVITPLRINGTDSVVLVDRGWIPALENHLDIPVVDTPKETQQVTGLVWLPSSKFYSLGNDVSDLGAWHPVWQNMDMKRYNNAVPFPVLPMVIRLDANSRAGGFIRKWVRPDDRVDTNIGYAYQWFGFAFAALAIYLFVSTKKITQGSA